MGLMIKLKTAKKTANQFFVLLVLVLFINFPLVNALEISNVRAEEITDTAALIVWETDEDAGSIVNYGQDKENLQRSGDAAPVNVHEFQIAGLDPEATYYYSVESSTVVDNNAGEFYSFTTLALDTEAPSLAVEMPEFIAGNKLELNGTTEIRATVSLFVNNVLTSTAVSEAGDIFTGDDSTGAESNLGFFSFTNVLLQENILNTIRVESADRSGNLANFTGTVFSDTHRPEITLKALPALTGENRISLNGTVSENCTIEILVNNRSVNKFSGSIINEEINLQEGSNIITVIAQDKAGFEAKKELAVNSDTRPPRVSFELTRGTEYYEGRAETDLTGETEPGATVYLYIYQPRVDDYQADFKKALQKTTADSEGKFEFKELEFPPPRYTDWKDFAPREVPSGLEEIMIPPLSDVGEEQEKSYYVYVIAEDSTGKSDYDRKIVRVHTCYSANFAFDIYAHPDFPPQPFRLDPQLIEEGRETIGAVFVVEYSGSAVATVDSDGEEQGSYKVLNVRFDPACTREMVEEDDYNLGCQLLGSLSPHPNADNSIYYVTGNLRSGDEFLETEDDFWDDFQKRQLKFPIKILVNYQEREPDGSWGERKTQVSCYNLGYFVDIPIESSDMVPDFLAEEGVEALNWTINAIEDVKPILETAMLVAGVSCGISMLVKVIAKFFRNFMSNLEHYTSIGQEDGCPGSAEQGALYLDSTIEYWNELRGRDPQIDKLGTLESLSERCPGTASAWEFESTLDSLYKFTCDRFFCREVPAGWTEDAEREEVERVEYSQDSCAATSRCQTLRKVENCQEERELNTLNAGLTVSRESSFECYYYDGYPYIVDIALNNEHPEMREQGITILTPANQLGSLEGVLPPTLLAFQPEDSDDYCVAVDDTCRSRCRERDGYRATDKGYDLELGTTGPCYREVREGTEITLADRDGNGLQPGQIAAGVYTRDCFIDEDDPDSGLYQCVCESEDMEEYNSEMEGHVRLALKGEEDFAEEWIYRQDKLFKESGGDTKTCNDGEYGTCYQSWRYFSGRDFTAAFGLNFGFDNFMSEPEDMSSTTVDPGNYWGAWQTLCLPKINAQLTALQSFLIGLRNCIIEAKYTQSWDAGMCKTFFTQQICGLIYQGLSALVNDCSPTDFSEGEEAEVSDIEAGWNAFRDAIPQTIEQSREEISSDYGASAEQFFVGGTEGMAQSMCLAFFGYDVPIFDLDYIMDAAYSVPMKTAIYFPIATREMTTFDPARGTATFNYRLGGFMVPGCKIREYKVELRCIGIEDLGNPGIDESCDGQGCDCLRITEETPVMGERSYPVKTEFNTVTKLQNFEFPIESPLRVPANYRYDHVMVELYLEQGEDADLCFDDGYHDGRKATYYFPITHLSGAAGVEDLIGGPAGCFVHSETGRFICPSLQSLFTGGQTYLEPPFVRCFDSRNDEWVDCLDTPNLFLSGDEVVIKTYLNLGEEEACLKISERQDRFRPRFFPFTGGLLGPFQKTLSLGQVGEDFLNENRIANLVVSGNNNRCDRTISEWPADVEVENDQEIEFNYQKNTENGKYTLKVDSQVEIGGSFSRDNDFLVDSANNRYFTVEELNDVTFSFAGFEFSLDLEDLDDSGKCVFRTDVGGISENNVRSLSVDLELLQPGPSGSCEIDAADTRLPNTNFGRVFYNQQIRIQRDAVEVEQARDIHDDFMEEDYGEVIRQASRIVGLGVLDLNDALALYYWAASLVMLNEENEYQEEIKDVLQTFFAREYPADVTGSGEYQKIQVYLCEVSAELGGEYANDCERGGIAEPAEETPE